jgi:hypothetical protein
MRYGRRTCIRIELEAIVSVSTGDPRLYPRTIMEMGSAV